MVSILAGLLLDYASIPPARKRLRSVELKNYYNPTLLELRNQTMAGALVGGAALSAFLQVVFQKLASRSLLDFISGGKPMAKRLKTAVVSAEAVLYDAAAKHIPNPSVREWLAELQDAAKDGRDLLEEISAESSPGKSGSKLSTNKSLQMILDRLERMTRQKDVLILKELGEKRICDSPTTSLVRESHIYGRDDDVKAIVSLLLANDVTTDLICTTAIVGVAGVGKTTLAQHVLNDHRVKNSFDLGVWVCLSSQPDTWTATKSIFDAVTLSNSDIKDLNQLQLRLKEAVSGKKLLLVLDDVRSQNSLEWDTLRSPFRFCARESAVLVTSRDESIAGGMCTRPPYRLSPLSYEAAWDIFANHALLSRFCPADPRLEAIGREIVQKCSGLPGTTKALGIFLRSKPDPEEWEKVLEHSVLYSSGDISKTLMMLKDETNRGTRKTEARISRGSPARVDECSHKSANRRIKMNLACFMVWVTLLSIFSGVVFTVVNKAHVTKRKRALGLMCDQRARMLQDQFVFGVNHIHALGILLTRSYYSKNALDSKQMQELFADYVTSTAVLHPYLSGTAYAERVINANRKKFERDHGWEIKTLGETSTPEPSPTRDEYAPVVFSSQAIIHHVVSLDMMSGKMQEDREIILKARSTGLLALSAPLRLRRSHHFGFVFACPVYVTKLPPEATLDQRIRGIVGYTGAAFDFQSFAENVLSQLDGNRTVLVTAYDVTNSSLSMLMYGGGKYNGSDEHLLHESKLELGDPSWEHKILCRYRRNEPKWSAVITTASFFTIGLLLGCILHSAVFHMLKTREASDRIRKLETRAEATHAANSQFLTTASREIKMPAYGILDNVTLLLRSESESNPQGVRSNSSGM